jgi:hypothetical protein
LKIYPRSGLAIFIFAIILSIEEVIEIFPLIFFYSWR